MNWREQTRTEQMRRRRRFFAHLATVYVIWFGSIGLGWWLWTVVFDEPPPSGLAAEVFIAGGTVLLTLLMRYGPVLPFRGKSPEEAAAEAFLSKEDVRSDDHSFEPGLKD